MLAADISRQDETASALGGDAVVPFRVDVTDEASVEAMFVAAVEAFGRVDASLLCWYCPRSGARRHVDGRVLDCIMAVDLKGVMLCTKSAIRTMLNNWCWSSTGGMNGSRMPTSVYSAAKAGGDRHHQGRGH